MKNAILATLLAICATAVNAESTAPVKIDAAPPAAVTQSTAVTPVALSSAAAIEKLREWDTKLQSLACEFTQTVKFGDSGMASVIEGSVRYQKPNQLRVEHFSPRKQIVVTDKKTISIYSPENQQLVKTDWDSWISQQSAIFSGVTNFGDYNKILADHNVKVVTGKTAVDVTLTPKKGKTSYALTLSLDPTNDYFPAVIVMRIGTTDVKTVLRKITLNGPLPAGVFSINTPEGTRVINF